MIVGNNKDTIDRQDFQAPTIVIVRPQSSGAHLGIFGRARMGSGWWIKTFDRAKWDAIFGSRRTEAEQKIVDAQLGEIEGYFDGSEELRPGPDRQEILDSPDGQAAIILAAHLIENGFTYDDLGEPQAVMLDDFARTVCARESLGDFLDIKWHSPGFLGELPILRLLDRLGYIRSPLLRRFKKLMGSHPQQGEPRYLPMLMTGRRFGTQVPLTYPRHCHYAIFSPAEVVELRQEVVAAINAPAPWKDATREPAETEKYFLAPLTEVVNSGRWMHMSYS
jgi:hypothetical protein